MLKLTEAHVRVHGTPADINSRQIGKNRFYIKRKQAVYISILFIYFGRRKSSTMFHFTFLFDVFNACKNKLSPGFSFLISRFLCIHIKKAT